jgi:hypothetical protein
MAPMGEYGKSLLGLMVAVGALSALANVLSVP